MPRLCNAPRSKLILHAWICKRRSWSVLVCPELARRGHVLVNQGLRQGFGHRPLHVSHCVLCIAHALAVLRP